jgi:hypothetical protein
MTEEGERRAREMFAQHFSGAVEGRYHPYSRTA